MRLFLGLVLCGIVWMSASAQERCASASIGAVSTSAQTASDPSTLPPVITIPVVVHILWRMPEENISDNQILSQLESINADFDRRNADFTQVPSVFAARSAATGIRFVLATTDPEGRPTTGILRKQTSALLWINDDRIKSSQTGGSDPWDPQSYLNIWVGNLSSSLLGFSSFPGAPAAKDGIVIRYNVFGSRGRLSPPWNLGRTLTHEAGHWLGLRHLWGDTPCGDDGIDDTPRQKAGNRGIPAFPLLRSECANGPDGDMFMNFMDLSDDAALLMFTRGQAALMRQQFYGLRKGILGSKGAGEPWNLTAAQAARPRFYPNPACGYIQIEGIPSDTQVQIFNSEGQFILQHKMGAGRMDLPHLPPGIYRLRLGREEQTMIVQR
ncbi:MAG: T9SS type A sorting domain-containing protein [Bacteroidetes bacterium]|nr:T9SS type A sorting domain-containing protein [Bacteroidota bacterium]